MLLGVVIASAEKSVSNLFYPDGYFVDFAIIVAQLTYFMFHRDLFPIKGKAAER